MTDIEIVRLCAEAMETPATLPGSSRIWGVTKHYAPVSKTTTFVRSDYNPLHDDAQAMSLVKKFHICHQWHEGSPNIQGRWQAWTRHADGQDSDLNRAICECVAKMQEENGLRKCIEDFEKKK